MLLIYIDQEYKVNWEWTPYARTWNYAAKTHPSPTGNLAWMEASDKNSGPQPLVSVEVGVQRGDIPAVRRKLAMEACSMSAYDASYLWLAAG